MPRMLRSDFAKAALKLGAVALVAAFAYTDTLERQEATADAIATASQPLAPLRQSQPPSHGPLPWASKFAEGIAGMREERDRLNKITETAVLQKAGISGAHRIAPTAVKPG